MIYLDNSAIQKPKPEVVDTVVNVLRNQWYNASSIYDKGLESKRIVENTRGLIANEINCSNDEIVFCGSGSEANSLAIDGWLKANERDSFICSTIEHSSILNNPNAIYSIRCDDNGFYRMDDIEKISDMLVSIQMANNEIGVIQNIKKCVEVLHKNNCIVHTDAVQAFGHIPINVKDLGVDMLTATSQKIGGICGSAFLYVKNGIKLQSIIHGTQESNLRGSTYNVPAIAAFGKAIELIDYSKENEIRAKRNYLINKIWSNEDIKHEVYVNGVPTIDRKRLANNLNIQIENVDAQMLLALLDLNGICVSAGSACHAGDKEVSYVLKAIGLSDKEARESIRITLNEDTTYEEIDKFVEILEMILTQFVS